MRQQGPEEKWVLPHVPMISNFFLWDFLQKWFGKSLPKSRTKFSWTRTISTTEEILNAISFPTNAAVVEIANQSSLSLKQIDFAFSEVHISRGPLHLPGSYIINREKQLTMCFESFSNNVHRRVASCSIWYVSWRLDQFFLCAPKALWFFIRNINLSFRGFFWRYPIFHYSISERTLLPSLVMKFYNLESQCDRVRLYNVRNNASIPISLLPPSHVL